MKRKILILIAVSTALVLAFSGLEPAAPAPHEGFDYVQDCMPYAQRANRLNDAAKASDIIGMTVQNYQNETLGKVNELAVDMESGRIVQVIVATGGLMGRGKTLTAVPPGALHRDGAHKVLHLNADPKKLTGAPKFDMAQWAEASAANPLSAVYRHYGEETAFRVIQTEDALRPISPRQAERVGDRVRKASQLLGMAVKNRQEEKLGLVENLLVDLPAGRVVAVILSTGRFLGKPDELSAVPLTVFRFSMDRDTLQMDVAKEQLSRAPHFQAGQWPDFAQPSYTGEVYLAYKVEPYFPPAETNVVFIQNGCSDPTTLNSSFSPAVITEPENPARKVIIAGKTCR